MLGNMMRAIWFLVCRQPIRNVVYAALLVSICAMQAGNSINAGVQVHLGCTISCILASVFCCSLLCEDFESGCIRLVVQSQDSRRAYCFAATAFCLACSAVASIMTFAAAAAVCSLYGVDFPFATAGDVAIGLLEITVCSAFVSIVSVGAGIVCSRVVVGCAVAVLLGGGVVRGVVLMVVAALQGVSHVEGMDWAVSSLLVRIAGGTVADAMLMMATVAGILVAPCILLIYMDRRPLA